MRTFALRVTRGISFGHLAQPGFVDPYWAPIKVQPAGLDRFDVVDDPSRPLPPGHIDRWGNGITASTFNRWFEVCKTVAGSVLTDDRGDGGHVHRATGATAAAADR